MQEIRATVTPLAIAALVAIVTPVSRAEESCLGTVCIQAGAEGDALVFDAVNRMSAPVTISLRFDELQNLRAYPRLPPAQMVSAGGSKRIAQFLPANPARGWRYRYNWSWVMGDPDAVHDDAYRYRMPFGGLEDRHVSQSYDGGFTHTGAHRYALDIAMPIGTPILAARAGRVILVNDGYTAHGISDDYLSKANAVYVMHTDHTVATYAHLDPGAGVRAGMRVRTGDVIGFSGNTGYSTGPHLHFEVWKPTRAGSLETIPVRFLRDAVASRSGVPATGDLLPPGCHSDGRTCEADELPADLGFEDRREIQRHSDGTCRCVNGSIITTHLPCRMVCPKR